MLILKVFPRIVYRKNLARFLLLYKWIQEVIEKRTDPQYEKRIDGCRRLAQWEWIYVLPESTIG
ncbi:hypothetical protein EY675_09125 [Enterococcus casseliflavus]|nr:hypothetical protein [Enterococcus casseliflavus]